MVSGLLTTSTSHDDDEYVKRNTMCVVSAMEGFISLTVHFKKTTIKTMGSAPSNVAHEDHHHVYTLYCGEKARKIQAVTDHWQPVFCCVANNQKKQSASDVKQKWVQFAKAILAAESGRWDELRASKLRLRTGFVYRMVAVHVPERECTCDACGR